MPDTPHKSRPHYRAYLVDPAGHFHGVRVLVDCETDDQAIVMAKQYVNGCDVQLWDRGRPVAKISNEQGIPSVQRENEDQTRMSAAQGREL